MKLVPALTVGDALIYPAISYLPAKWMRRNLTTDVGSSSPWRPEVLAENEHPRYEGVGSMYSNQNLHASSTHAAELLSGAAWAMSRVFSFKIQSEQ